MTKKQKKQQAINEDRFIQSLPQPLKGILGFIKYNLKELLILIIVLIIGYILMFNVYINCDNVEYRPQKIKDFTGD